MMSDDTQEPEEEQVVISPEGHISIGVSDTIELKEPQE